MQILTPKCKSQKLVKSLQIIDNEGNQYTNVSQEQISIQLFEDNEFQAQNFQPSICLKIFFSYLYFSQGLILSLCGTMPYIYPELPSYDVMAMFNAATLPFCFKFVLAPLIEKFSFFKYGKRKLWIVISQILVSFCLFLSSFFTSFDQSFQMSVLLFTAVLFLTLQDISLDSLAKKQLRHAHITSNVSITNQLTGSILGSMLLLKLTSIQFAHDIGLEEPVAKSSTIIVILTLLVFIPSVFIHFYFKEIHLKREYQSMKINICEIYCSYKAFFRWKSKYFRTVVFLLVMNQGFNFFYAGYDYQLVKAGFSRNTSNTIQNVISIPINIIACFMTSKIQDFGVKKGLIISMTVQLLICFYLRVFFPLDIVRISLIAFIGGLMSMWAYMISTIFTYEFPIHRYSGMYITALFSFSNLGNSSALHTKILAWLSWWKMSWVGISLEALLLIWMAGCLYDWKNQGVTDIEDILNGKQGFSKSSGSQKESENIQFQSTK